MLHSHQRSAEGRAAQRRAILAAVCALMLAFALVPLVVFTSRRELMGPLVNTRWTTAAAWGIATLIIALNAFLLYETFLGG